jgi:hypothetical protein
MRSAAVGLCLILAVTACAAGKADPNGTWKYTVEVQGNTIESVATLKLEGDKLTGTVKRASGEMEAKIEEGKFKDGEVSFQVTRERDGEKLVIKYKGKITGDELKGKINGSFMGNDFELEWNAKREKK